MVSDKLLSLLREACSHGYPRAFRRGSQGGWAIEGSSTAVTGREVGSLLRAGLLRAHGQVATVTWPAQRLACSASGPCATVGTEISYRDTKKARYMRGRVLSTRGTCEAIVQPYCSTVPVELRRPHKAAHWKTVQR